MLYGSFVCKNCSKLMQRRELDMLRQRANEGSLTGPQKDRKEKLQSLLHPNLTEEQTAKYKAQQRKKRSNGGTDMYPNHVLYNSQGRLFPTHAGCIAFKKFLRDNCQRYNSLRQGEKKSFVTNLIRDFREKGRRFLQNKNGEEYDEQDLETVVGNAMTMIRKM